ncbi:MAG: oligosaccharide flippase family protein [Clostridia bacterium]|nr:oligosaccharide flippase family protein [Clostridia bacterium]
MTKSKQLFINLSTTLVGLVINTLISFGLSKYIVATIGEEAYGFVSLANSFIMYATILTVAVNSMASRFITLSMQRGEIETANKYFSSVLISNAVIIGVLIVPATVLIAWLENIINISSELVTDVKLLFFFIILNFFVSLIGGVFSVATYCTNKLHLTSLRTMESNVIKALVIVSLFVLFKPAVFYIGVATLISGSYVVLFNMRYTKQLLPDIKIKSRNFELNKIKILLSSGVWNSITNLGNVLSDGLDLIISNLAVNPATMGIVALAKTPGNVINTVMSSISNVFQPQIISFYSQNDIDGVLAETKQSMKITGVFGNIPFAYIVVFGYAFGRIWVPEVDAVLLHRLLILTFLNIFCGGVISSLYNVFTITNRVKGNAILNVGSGFLSTVLVFLLISVTNLGVYAIVGVSAFVGLLKGFLVIPVLAARCLKVPNKTFFGVIIKYFFSTAILVAILYALKCFMVIDGWIPLIISVLVSGILGVLVDYFVLFSGSDRKRFMYIFISKFKEKGNE